MRKLFFLFVALLATTSLWAYSFKSGMLCYKILTDSTVEVTFQSIGAYSITYDKYYTSLGNNYPTLTSVSIPETVNYDGKTYTVVAIGNYAFTAGSYYRFTTSTSVAQDTIAGTSINNKLTLVNIPKTVKTIGNYAFYNCTVLKTVNFGGDGLRRIGDYAFWDNEALHTFVFPNTLQKIGSYAFAANQYSSISGLTGALVLPNSVWYVGSNAFAYLRLDSVTATGVTSLGKNAFSNCSRITSVKLGDALTTIQSSTFYSCKSLSSVQFGNSVRRIETQAFQNCSSLTSIVLPKSLSSIGDEAFNGCSKLTTVYLNSTTPPSFTNTNILPSSATTFYVPCDCADTYFWSDWVTFTHTFIEQSCKKKYTIYVNQDCTSTIEETSI